MAVPAHDERDFAFAKKYGLPITVVIAPPDWDGEPLTEAYIEPGDDGQLRPVRRHAQRGGQDSRLRLPREAGLGQAHGQL